MLAMADVCDRVAAQQTPGSDLWKSRRARQRATSSSAATERRLLQEQAGHCRNVTVTKS
jgi:hypothetical protein